MFGLFYDNGTGFSELAGPPEKEVSALGPLTRGIEWAEWWEIREVTVVEGRWTEGKLIADSIQIQRCLCPYCLSLNLRNSGEPIKGMDVNSCANCGAI
jgi:hypothetical protein